MISAFTIAYGRPSYDPPPYSAPVLGLNAVGVGMSDAMFDQDELLTPDVLAYDPTHIMYMPMFFGDYFNRVYIIPGTMTLIDPPLDTPNLFYFWNTNFDLVTVDTITAFHATGLEIDIDLPFALGDLKLVPAALIVTKDASFAEEATFTFGCSDGEQVLWRVSLLRTNLLVVTPETPINETLRWKTDILAGEDGTEQRITTTQFARIEHDVEIIFLDDEEQRTIYEQFISQANVPFAYPLWGEQTRLLADVVIGDTIVRIDLSKFDLEVGDTIYMERNEGVHEAAVVAFIGLDRVSITLSSGLQNTWTTDDPVYRVTQVRIPDKPSLDRAKYGYVAFKSKLRFIEFRDLFSADAAALEIDLTTVFSDRVLSQTVYTMNGIPVLHARPLADDVLKEEFDWKFEVIDYDTGTFDYLTNRTFGAVTMPRKFYIKNLDQKFYWNWVLKWLHGQRRPCWIPTWVNDIGVNTLTITSNVVTVQGVTYSSRFKADNSHRALWIAYKDGWVARQISNVDTNDDGNTVITLTHTVPPDYPTDGPHDVGFLILSRQATDEVHREIHPIYSFLSTAFVGTKTSPEVEL